MRRPEAFIEFCANGSHAIEWTPEVMRNALGVEVPPGAFDVPPVKGRWVPDENDGRYELDDKEPA